MRCFCVFLLVSAVLVGSSPVCAQAANPAGDVITAAVEPEKTADERGAYERLVEAVRNRDWSRAELIAASAGPLIQRLVQWHKLRAGDGVFREYRAFLADHKNWPGLELMHDRGEETIGPDEEPDAVVAYFGDKIPETGVGILRLIEAYIARGESGNAQALAVLAWRGRALNEDVEAALLQRFPKLLAPHHEARLDYLLWTDSRAAALRQMERVGEDWQRLAEARQALRTLAAGVDGKIEAVPGALRNHPGLAWERYNWRIRKGLNDTAIDLLKEYSTSAEALGRPEMWSNYRRIYARRLMREGKASEAYALASRHFLVEGSDFADLEWLAGYIALRQLQDPELALWHFGRFASAVSSPISLGRAGYWRGRAYEAMGNAEKAREAYLFGAQYQTSFYGLLAAEAAGLPMDEALTGREKFPPVEQTSFASSDVFVLGMRLLEEGDRALAKRFLTHLAESLPRKEAGSLGELLLARGEVNLALMIAKRVAQRGIILPASYYPLHPMAKEQWPVAPELALSIARRESEFDPLVVSPAGARGLMQLMPGTAKDVAGELEIPYELGRLTTDPNYNAKLGTNYLSGLTEVFGNAPVLISVGYNAGPRRAVNWVSDQGDPRYPGIDIIDWIEMIPFRETRNYVMRVTESLPIYRARLSGQTEKLNFTALLRGTPN